MNNVLTIQIIKTVYLLRMFLLKNEIQIWDNWKKQTQNLIFFFLGWYIFQDGTYMV